MFIRIRHTNKYWCCK